MSASSPAVVRAFSAGMAPMIPALHCAITSAAVEAMNIGPAMTGRRSLPFSRAASRTALDRVPGEDVGGAVQRIEVVGEHRKHPLRDGFRRPAVRGVRRADRPWLREQIDF